MYQVEFFSRVAPHTWEVTETRRVGTLRAAELCAESMLRPHRVVTTQYNVGRDMGRAPFCRIAPMGKRGERDIEPECVIVPSVGELGWTP